MLRKTLKNWRNRLTILRYLIGPEIVICLVAMVLTLLVAFADLLGVALVIPLLGADIGGVAPAGNPILEHLTGMVSGMTVQDRLWFAGTALVVIVMIRATLQFASLKVRADLPTRIELRLAKISYDTLMRVKMSFIHNREVGELTTVLVSYPNRASKIIESLVSIVAQSLSFCVFAVSLLVIDPILTIVALASLGGSALVVKFVFHGRMADVGRKQNAVAIAASQLIYETFGAMRLVRLRNAEQFFRDRHARIIEGTAAVKRRAVFLSGAPVPLFALVTGLTIAAVILAFALVRGDDADIATLIVFLLVLTRLGTPVNTISSAFTNVKSLVPALAAFLDFMQEAAKQIQERGHLSFKGFKNDIVFKDVCLRYERNGQFALDHLNLIIPYGRTVGVVGASGAGKSSLVSVLTRLQEITSGSILVDGQDLAQIKLEDWRSQLGVVTQEAIIVNDTVRNNLRFGQSDIDDEELLAALELADARGFVMEMPKGLDTVLGDAGVRLSGGQRQRLSLARALVQKSEIVILDEATSSLDSLSEGRIQRGIAAALAAKTAIVIAHRLSTVRDADLIVVMERGAVIEQGRHDELMAMQGRYFEMVTSQSLERGEPGTERIEASATVGQR